MFQHPSMSVARQDRDRRWPLCRDGRAGMCGLGVTVGTSGLLGRMDQPPASIRGGGQGAMRSGAFSRGPGSPEQQRFAWPIRFVREEKEQDGNGGIVSMTLVHLLEGECPSISSPTIKI